MQYNSDADDQDIITEILLICGATTNTYSLKDMTRRFNSALDRYFSIAFDADGRWNFDDINNAAPPIDTQDIVSGTNRYKIGTFTEKVLSLIKLEVLDSAGKGIELIREDISNLDARAPGNASGYLNGGSSTRTFQELYLSPTSGTPTHYTKYGDFIYLRPSPDYNETAGLKAYFNRPASYMASTDTTKVPGVPGTHHTYLARAAALPYLIEKELPQAQSVAQEVLIGEQEIRTYFSHRDKDNKQRMVGGYQNNK